MSRLRSVRASFHHSWELLSHDEQQALMRLSVFRGGCTCASAKGVARADSGVLASLVNKSILTHDLAVDRYYMHELIRQLAAERLHKSGQEAAANRKHARFYLSHALNAWAQVEKDNDWETYYRRVGPELDNCRVALQRSLASVYTQTALQLATAIAQYLYDHGMILEAIRWLKEALADDEEHSPIPIRAAAYLSLADVWWEKQGAKESMIELAEKGLELYQTTGDQENVARALYSCGFAYMGYDWDRSRACLTKSIEIYQNIGIEPYSSLEMLSSLEVLTGNFEEAILLIDRLRVRFKKNDESELDTNMAKIYYYQGQLDKAQNLAEKALLYRRTHGPESKSIHQLDILVHIALDKRQLGRARALLRERLRILVNSDHYWTSIYCLDKVAEWLLHTGHPHQAAFWLGCFDRAREWVKQPVEPVAIPYYHWLQFEVRSALGEADYVAAWEKGYAVPIEEMPLLALQAIEQTSPEPTDI